jgi:cell wall hydrolase
MFGFFRARVVALTASLFVVLWASPAAAAETNPNLEGLGILLSRQAPAPASALPGTDGTAGAVPNAADRMKSPRPLHDLVISFVDYGNQDADELCLAKAVYFEARGETLDGQLAVAQVVLNRASSGVYPPTVCGVVTQPAQFSFVRGGRMPPPDTASACWHKALAVADIAMKHLASTVVPSNVLWYHADYVAPAWGRQHVRVAQIGTHIFYN